MATLQKERKYYRTLFIPELVGQTTLWDKIVSQEAQTADEIIQMGDFITCYPEIKSDTANRELRNLNITKRLELYKATQPNWLQIVGPNEIVALNQPGVFTNEDTDRTLRRLWFSENAIMKVAGVNKSRLVTHGGLTHGLWLRIGSPESAQEAAESLNKLYSQTLFQGESYLLGGPPNYSANPIFANPILETYPSWLTAEEKCPFDQINSSENISTGVGRLLRGNEHSVYDYADAINLRRFGSTVLIKNTLFTGLAVGLEAKLSEKIPNDRSFYKEEALILKK